MSKANAEWADNFLQLKDLFKSAYHVISEGIRCEEQGDPHLALKNYKEGLLRVDEALRIPVTCPDNPDPTWDEACQMVKRLKRYRGETISRITVLETEASSPSSSFEMIETPPSYDEAVGNVTPSTSDGPQKIEKYSELAEALKKVESSIEVEPETVYICEGVKLYFISPNGEVSSSTIPQTLKITLVKSDDPNAPSAILQVGTWVYPLIPGVSPCYRTDYGAFILPNVYAETPNSSIGIILPPDADKDAYEILESILYGIVGQYKKPELDRKPSVSESIASSMVNGASYLTQKLLWGAEKVDRALNDNTPKVIEKLKPAETKTEVPTGVAKSMKVAKCATNTAVKVTGYVAETIGCATVKLGNFLAPHIQRHGTNLLSKGFRMSEQEAENKVKGVMTVAAGATEAFVTVYRGLETSALILGESLKNNTVKVVQHKYGEPVGELTENTLSTVGNVVHISHNAKIIQPKNLAKRAVKEAGKAVVYEYRLSNREVVPESSGSCNKEKNEKSEKID